jgi:hypothetical protein
MTERKAQWAEGVIRHRGGLTANYAVANLPYGLMKLSRLPRGRLRVGI